MFRKLLGGFKVGWVDVEMAGNKYETAPIKKVVKRNGVVVTGAIEEVQSEIVQNSSSTHTRLYKRMPLGKYSFTSDGPIKETSDGAEFPVTGTLRNTATGDESQVAMKCVKGEADYATQYSCSGTSSRSPHKFTLDYNEVNWGRIAGDLMDFTDEMEREASRGFKKK